VTTWRVLPSPTRQAAVLPDRVPGALRFWSALLLGADLTYGGLVNLLIWRPRRLTVLGTKLGTLLGFMLVVSVLASAAYLGTFWMIGQTAGLPGKLDDEFWRSLGVTYGRGLVLVLFASAIGFAITTLGRRTAAALGAVTAYAVLWEAGARLVMMVLDVPRSEQWMLSTYLDAWLTGEARIYDPSLCRGASGYCDGTTSRAGWSG
jgi:hypothetical protein